MRCKYNIVNWKMNLHRYGGDWDVISRDIEDAPWEMARLELDHQITSRKLYASFWLGSSLFFIIYKK